MRKKHDWSALVEAHARSGRTQKAFCEERGIHPVTFSINRRKLLKQAAGAHAGGDRGDKGSGSAQGFVRARPSTGRSAAATAKLELSLGVMTLRFAPDTSPAYVAALVEALA